MKDRIGRYSLPVRRVRLAPVEQLAQLAQPVRPAWQGRLVRKGQPVHKAQWGLPGRRAIKDSQDPPARKARRVPSDRPERKGPQARSTSLAQ
jgi:hypothetical protein